MSATRRRSIVPVAATAAPTSTMEVGSEVSNEEMRRLSDNYVSVINKLFNETIPRTSGETHAKLKPIYTVVLNDTIVRNFMLGISYDMHGNIIKNESYPIMEATREAILNNRLPPEDFSFIMDAFNAAIMRNNREATFYGPIIGSIRRNTNRGLRSPNNTTRRGGILSRIFGCVMGACRRRQMRGGTRRHRRRCT